LQLPWCFPLAFAQGSGWYVGASAGQSKGKDSCPSFVPGGTVCDDTGSAYGVSSGYQFNKYLGAELGYTDLGENNSISPVDAVTMKAKGVELLGVGTFPINPQFEVYGKVGVFFWDLDASCAGTWYVRPRWGSGLGGPGSQSDSGTDLTYGLGATLNFTKNVGMRVQYQRYKDIDSSATTGGKSDIDVISVGIVFKL
jgi:OOP family OmpA-OmpF porin